MHACLVVSTWSQALLRRENSRLANIVEPHMNVVVPWIRSCFLCVLPLAVRVCVRAVSTSGGSAAVVRW